MGERIVINEVGLRDGLQNQPRTVPTDEKLVLLDALLAAGIEHVEAASFVSPKAVPQMADATELYPRLPHAERIDYSALVPNMKGYERAVAAGARSIAVTPASTEGMNRANLNMSLEQAAQVAEDVMRRAKADGIHGRTYLATAFVCPFDGPTDPKVVHGLAERMFKAGAAEVIIADTIGAANPQAVSEMFRVLVANHGATHLSGHFHDTQGMALANCWAAAERGIRKFDASVGGLGGCPFAPGAAGNAATEDVVNLFNGAGFETGIDLDKLKLAIGIAETATGRTLGGRWMAWRRTQDARREARAATCAA
jgi:hydroxymethylglutaryl-CoA lyase